jgi:hypothetical protein
MLFSFSEIVVDRQIPPGSESIPVTADLLSDRLLRVLIARHRSSRRSLLLPQYDVPPAYQSTHSGAQLISQLDWGSAVRLCSCGRWQAAHRVALTLISTVKRHNLPIRTLVRRHSHPRRVGIIRFGCASVYGYYPLGTAGMEKVAVGVTAPSGPVRGQACSCLWRV